MKFSFSTTFELIKLSCTSLTNETLYNVLVDAIGGYPIYNSGTLKKWKDGNPIPKDLIDSYLNLGMRGMTNYLQSSLIPKIKYGMTKKLTQIILEIIEIDPNLNNDDPLGFPEAPSKKKLLESNEYVLPELIANILFYSMCNNSKPDKQDELYLKDLKQNGFIAKNPRNFVLKISPPIERPSPINLTAKIKSFKDTFTQIHSSLQTSLPSTTVLEIYSLNIKNGNFSFEYIKNFIKLNISSYTFSTLVKEEYAKADMVENLTYDAVAKIAKTQTQNNSQNFVDLMIYSFLECALKAPKLLSSFELRSKDKNRIAHSSGIHLLQKGTIGPNNQLVFGATALNGNLPSAVEEIVKQILNIKQNETNEYSFVNQATLYSTFSKEATDYLKEALIPSPYGIPTIDNAFGIFITYPININKNGLSNSQIKEKIEDKMKSDIINIIPLIEKSILDNKLENHSFFFYFLPLDEPQKNAESLLSSLMPKGDN